MCQLQHGMTGHNPRGGHRAGPQPPPLPQPHSAVIWGPGGELLLRLLAEGAGRRGFRLFICLLNEFPDFPPHHWYQRGDITGPQRQRWQLSSPVRASPGEGR